MKISEILKKFPSIEMIGEDVEVKDLCIKAQDAKEYDLFIALEGEKSHGLEWEKEAISKGAKAVLSNKKGSENTTYLISKNLREILPFFSFEFYNNPQKGMNLISITGTTGKTTTAQMIFYGISNFKKAGFIGTTHYQIGKNIIPSSYTTPESPLLAKLFFDLKNEQVEYVVMEVSSHSLKQKRVEALKFQNVIFTNIGRDHLDFHKTEEDYIKSKFHLIDLMDKKGTIIYNLDEEKFKNFKDLKVKKITYSAEKKATVYLISFKQSKEGSEGTISIDGKKYTFKIPLFGFYNIKNFLAAISCLYSLNFPIEDILENFKNLPQIKGRLEKVEAGQKFPVIVDYAHTPEGFENALKTIKEIYNLKLITVFGAGGDRDRGKRRILGEVAGRYSEIVIITTDNPRSEDPVKICEEIKEGVFISGQDKVLTIIDRQKAIEKAIEMANQNFVVVLLGKGHENYQIVKDKVYPFSDVKVAIKAIKEFALGI